MSAEAAAIPIRFRTSRRVEFVDTDMAGIVHYSNFFRFMEAAEVSFLLEGRVSVLKKDPAGSDRQIGAWFAPAVVGGLAAVEGARRSASCIAGAPSVVASLSAADAREVLADPGPAGAELRFILLSAFTEALANTTSHLRELLSQSPGPEPSDLDRLLALLHGAKR